MAAVPYTHPLPVIPPTLISPTLFFLSETFHSFPLFLFLVSCYTIHPYIDQLPSMTELKQSALPEYAPRAPELIPVAFINIKVNEPQGILTNSNYKQGINLVNVINGEVTSVPNKFGYELDVQNVVGYDHITGNTEAGINKLDCNLYGRTPNGSGVFIKYVGTIKVTESVGNTLSGKAKATDFEEEYVTNNPTFLFADTVEDKYKWALKENFIGKGRFVRDDEHKLYVQYYLYVLH